MSFLYPVFLLGALAIAVPIALHLLRRDIAPEVPFTAVRLLRKSPVERSRRRRLRDLLLLAARVAALLLLAAAFARPYLPRAEAAAAGLRIVAIDRSFSMGAPGRFEAALDLARAAIDEAGFTERVAVMTFDERADVLALPGGTADAKGALANLSPGHGATRYAAVIAKASELAAGGPARLVLVTDNQRAGWDGESRVHAPASITLDVRSVAARGENVAVAAVRVEGGRAIATVRNASAVPRQGTVTLMQDDAVVTRAPFSAGAESSVDVPLVLKPGAGAASVSVDDPAGFPADNVRHALVSRSGSATVMIVTAGTAFSSSAGHTGFYVVRALEAAGGAIETQMATAQEIAGGRAQSIGRHAAVLLLSTRSLDRPARDAIVAFVRGGGGLLVAAAPDVEPEVVTSMFGWPESTFMVDPTPRQLGLTVTDVRHPVFRPFGALAANLGQVAFRQAWRVRADSGPMAGTWDIPARFSDGSPAVLERREGAGRVLLVTSDLDRQWNDFPLHPSFVPFVVEAVRHVSSRQAQRQEFVVGQVPAGVSGEPGIHQGADGRSVAVNVDPRESSTADMTAAEFARMVEAVASDAGLQQSQVKAEQTEGRQSLWQYGLVLMLLTLVAESFVGRVP